MSIEDKLKEIVGEYLAQKPVSDEEWWGFDTRVDVDGAITQVIQAFKDAGWVNTKAVEFEGFTVDTLMTGQAWYDRFEKEIGKFNYDHRGSTDIYWSDELQKVAKKAAGLE